MNETVVAIIGRPNVGKSTLFNRIAGKRKALVHYLPGTTRDYNEISVSWNRKNFTLLDTGGWDQDNESFLSKEIKRQIEIAFEGSHIVIFVVDGKSGFHTLDKELNNFLRRYQKKTILVVNKIDTSKDETKALDFYKLGIPSLLMISANHGRNVYELMDKITDYIDNSNIKLSNNLQESISVTLVGKPNVGKSTLFNKLYKKDRNIVTDKPGTTREAVDIHIKKDDQDYVLIDTPGLHKKRKFKTDLDYLSALSAQKALERTDVAVLIIDAESGVGETETKIAELILKNNCACLIAINKWDTVEDRENTVKTFREQVEKKLQFMWWSKLIFISAKTGQRTERILDEVKIVYQEYSRTIPGDKLKELIQVLHQKRSMTRFGKTLRIQNIYQSSIRPPCFTFILNRPDLLHFSNRRYFENNIRKNFEFPGTPILLKFQGSKKKGKL